VFGYSDQGGKGMIQSSIDTGAFDTFMMGDGMYGDAIMADVGAYMTGSFGAVPWSSGPGTEAFAEITEAAGINGGSSFTRESYDAAALIALAMQSAGSVEPGEYKTHVMDVANEPGEKIYPGELGKALDILADGGEVNYEGATNVELIGPGEAAGTYREYVIEDADFKTVKFH
jgi:branched-chain amino acid transport system substrate-binding protein